jgi:hypothetical protein
MHRLLAEILGGRGKERPIRTWEDHIKTDLKEKVCRMSNGFIRLRIGTNNWLL